VWTKEEESQTGAVATSPEQKLAALRKVQDRLRKAKQVMPCKCCCCALPL